MSEKLWRVSIQRTLVVVAETEIDAIRIAERYERDECCNDAVAIAVDSFDRLRAAAPADAVKPGQDSHYVPTPALPAAPSRVVTAKEPSRTASR